MHHTSLQSPQSPNDEPRKSIPLPASLLDHCTTDLEEGLYAQAFTLLTSALTSGINDPSKPAQIPPPTHLALAATIAVHPQFTTRTISPDKHAAADDALRYLRQVNALLGPRNGGLDRAFRFTSDPGISSRGKRAKSRVEDVNGADYDDDGDANLGRIRSSYADSTASLWSNAADFPSLIGWAFNCSVAHPARWERWKHFLALLLDVLEADVEARIPEAQAAYAQGGNAAVRHMLSESLLTQYLLPIGSGRNSKRRLMRAIVADASRASLAEFGEIWRGETRGPKPRRDVGVGEGEEARGTKRRKLDLENGEFGDYFEDSELEDRSPGASGGPTPRSRSANSLPRSIHRSNGVTTNNDDNSDSDTSSPGAKTPNGTHAAPPTIASFGGTSSLHLRHRLLALLTHFSTLNPAQFLDKEDLFDIYTEFLRPLPLAVFTHFALPGKPYLLPADQAGLCQMVLRPLLAGAGPVYREVSTAAGAGAAGGGGNGIALPLTQADFETYYAPFPANKAEAGENAKVAVLVEGLLRLLWGAGALVVTGELSEVVGRGIVARREKVAWDGRRKNGVKARVEEEAVAVLEASGERMRMVLEMAEVEGR